MEQVPVRELNQHTAAVLAKVEAGQRVEITRNGAPIAVIAPAVRNRLRELIDSGELRPAVARLPLPPPDEPAAADEAGLHAVLAGRADERW